jgi:hypothetical protein
VSEPPPVVSFKSFTEILLFDLYAGKFGSKIGQPKDVRAEGVGPPPAKDSRVWLACALNRETESYISDLRRFVSLSWTLSSPPTSSLSPTCRMWLGRGHHI